MSKSFRAFPAVLALAFSATLASRAPAAAAPAPGFKYWDVADTSKAPRTLSATGLYPDIAAPGKRLLAEAYHYDVNSALWSDGAKKGRWVLVKPGTAIGFLKDGDYWKYPDSTVFIKLFAIDTIPGDSTSRVNWETRLLINKKELADSGLATQRKEDVWYGFSYKWNPDQKDAMLVSLKRGLNDSIRVYPNGKARPFVWKKWRFPRRSECNICHRVDYVDTLHGRSVLGFFTAQLNRAHPDSAGINQLEYFFKKGLLMGAKPANWNAADVPKWAPIEDNSVSLDLRARSYIAANCSGCHGRRGMELGATGQATLNYDYFDMKAQMEFSRHIVSQFFGADTVKPYFYAKDDPINNPNGYACLNINPALVVPGYPEKSILLIRQRSRNTAPGDFDPPHDQMPPLASYEVNVPATDLIERWIREMRATADTVIDTTCKDAAGITPAKRGRAGIAVPYIVGRVLRVPAAPSGSGPLGGADISVTMMGLDGRAVTLRRMGPDAWAIPEEAASGVCIVRVGGRNYMRYLSRP